MRLDIVPVVVLCSMLTMIPNAFATGLAQRTVLDSGATLLLSERNDLPMAIVTILLKSGASADPPDQTGVSNIVAKMLTRGTRDYSAEELAQALDFLGTSLSISPGTDFTTITLTTLSRNIDASFALLAQVVLYPTFPDHEFLRIKKEVLGGIRSHEEDPGWVAAKTFRERLFTGLPYGHLVTGDPATVKNISLRDVINYHSSHYFPKNAIIAVAGNTTTEQTRALLAQHMDDWKPAPAPSITWPIHTATRAQEILIDKAVSQANIIMGHVGISRGDTDYYPVLLMNYILGAGGFGSRLMDHIREKKGYVYSIHSHYSARKHQGPFSVSLQTKNETAQQAISETLAVIEEFRHGGATEEELAAAKAYFVNSFPLRLVSNKDIAAILPIIEFYELGLDYPNRYKDLIENVTLTDVNRAAKTHLRPNNFLRVVVANLSQAGYPNREETKKTSIDR